MSVFNKKKNQYKETNMIQNKDLQELVMNSAIQTLQKGVHYNDLEYMTYEFGYLFLIEGRGVESLFKVTTDKGLYYFAAQKNSVMLLHLNEEIYQNTITKFLSMHK